MGCHLLSGKNGRKTASPAASNLTAQSPCPDKAHSLRFKAKQVYVISWIVCALVISAQFLRLQSVVFMLGLVHSLRPVAEVCALCYCGSLRVLNSCEVGEASTYKFFE